MNFTENRTCNIYKLTWLFLTLKPFTLIKRHPDWTKGQQIGAQSLRWGDVHSHPGSASTYTLFPSHPKINFIINPFSATHTRTTNTHCATQVYFIYMHITSSGHIFIIYQCNAGLLFWFFGKKKTFYPESTCLISCPLLLGIWLFPREDLVPNPIEYCNRGTYWITSVYGT